MRAALSARVTAQGSGLEDLEGLQVVDVQLEGGRYEVPYLYLTVADPGSTALLPGEHVYNIEFDEQGRVDWLSPFGVRRGGDVLQRDNLDFTEQDGVRTASGVRISGQPADPLGLTLQAVTGETLRYHFTVAPDGAAGEEIIDEQTRSPGTGRWPCAAKKGTRPRRTATRRSWSKRRSRRRRKNSTRCSPRCWTAAIRPQSSAAARRSTRPARLGPGAPAAGGCHARGAAHRLACLPQPGHPPRRARLGPAAAKLLGRLYAG